MKKAIVISLFVFLLFSSGLSRGDQSYHFTCKDSKIKGAIKYGVIGTYNFSFQECLGTLVFDPLKGQVKSVELTIKTDSLKSNCDWCDRIILSKRLLDSPRYPQIFYESKTFTKTDKNFNVVGNIHLHGFIKPLKAAFSLNAVKDNELSLKGVWLIRRKDFRLTWNKLLDHGGVLVGEWIKLNWDIQALSQ